MTKPNRVPLQVSPKFSQRLKELQRKIRMKTGDEKSLRDLTEDIVSSRIFDEIENTLLNSNLEMDIKVKFDKRLLQ